MEVMKIAFVPIDNRPVCYQLPKMIADINPDAELLIPPIEYLGDLHKTANVEGLFDWLKNLSKVDAFVLSLDTIAYGGLIPSRRSPDTFDDIKSRIEALKNILLKFDAKVYAFSSVMRISNNNVNEEEKEYWNLYGEKIFKYSFDFHKFDKAETSVPQEILDDYLATRKRNFEINKIYLEWQKEGFFDTLVFSKDDCAEFGLNVMEAQELEKLGGFTKTGADEIPLALLARAWRSDVKIAPIFLAPEHKELISNYEDVSIERSVLSQIELAGCTVAETEDANVLLFVNNFEDKQGEIVMKRGTKSFSGSWNNPVKPYIVADVRFANGADNAFINVFLKENCSDNFRGYSAWNTSANTLGSLICAMKYTKKQNDAFKRLQVVRLLDDWAYQANVRQELQSPDVDALSEKMKPYEDKVREFLGFGFSVRYSFPWNRLFEVKIELI